MPSFSSISAVWLRVDQSDLAPMITPTSAGIVVPLVVRSAALQNQQAAQQERGSRPGRTDGRAGVEARNATGNPREARLQPGACEVDSAGRCAGAHPGLICSSRTVIGGAVFALK